MLISSLEDMIRLTEEYGFLPFFANDIDGFSVEDNTPAHLWFTDTDGPWEWKGPAAMSRRVVYGKLFSGKAGLVSVEWFPHLANYRRDGYDFDARYDDGLAQRKDKEIMDLFDGGKTLLSKSVKKLCNYRKGGNKGFETVITRLQMQTYLVVNNFVYMRTKYGEQYGWGVAEYTMPESIFGYDFVTSAYKYEPQQSAELIRSHLSKLFPKADEKTIGRILG